MSIGLVALRHYRDASLLHERGRRANADQLYGIAAECALKDAISGLGMPNVLGQPTDHRHREHVDVFWDIATAFLSGRVGARLQGLLGADRPFADWRVDQRYDLTQPTAAAVRQHASGAARALQVMDGARLLGCSG